MMSKLSKTFSSVLIGLLDVDFNSFAFLSFLKFSFVGQNFQKSKSADIGQQCVSNVCFWVLWCLNIIIYKMETVRTCYGAPTQYFIVKPRFLKNPQIQLSLSRFAAWYPAISKFLWLKSMMSQLSNAHSDVIIRCLDQKLQRFEVQKYPC